MSAEPLSRAAEYAPGRLLDTYGERSPCTILLWHGSGPDEREVLTPLATTLAARGLHVLVPDWDSKAPDGGRADLLQSVNYTRDLDNPFLVVGWSLGGTAAASLALNSRKLGLGFIPAVCLAGAFRTTDPLSGAPFASIAPSRRNAGSIRLVHGTNDDSVEPDGSREFADVLRAAGWDTALTELPLDHAGIVGTEFSADRNRCLSSKDPQVLAGLEQVATIIVEAAQRRPVP